MENELGQGETRGRENSWKTIVKVQAMRACTVAKLHKRCCKGKMARFDNVYVR